MARDHNSAGSAAAPGRVRDQQSKDQGQGEERCGNGTESARAIIGLWKAVTEYRDQETQSDDTECAVREWQRDVRMRRS